jgi:hypothetical protein
MMLSGLKIKEELPATWNKDFSFTIFHKGGMKPVNWVYRVYLDSCQYELDDVINNVQVKKKIRFTKKEKKKLLEILRTNKALSIRSVHSHGTPVYDKPTYGFTIQSKGKKYKVVSGELDEIETPHQENFEAIFSYAKTALDKKK